MTRCGSKVFMLCFGICVCGVGENIMMGFRYFTKMVLFWYKLVERLFERRLQTYFRAFNFKVEGFKQNYPFKVSKIKKHQTK